MEFKKIIFVVAGLVFLLSAPAALAWMPHASNIPAERTKRIHPFELSQKSIVVAENESETAENGAQATNENNNQAPESEAADSQKSGNSSEDAATRPIKPFKPSEEIAAEQAVDFPVDI